MTTTRELANAIRFLSMDAIQKANSGHPGMPLGMADIAAVLWTEFLHHNPLNPNWSNRDRFILSNGHGSMLHYSLLHLTGYALGIEELKRFRQLHSKTPGHPEYGLTSGIETTTGPLAQGLANAVGMALAEKTLAATFNRPSFNIVDHFTYVFCGDGCLMEGLSHEVCSFAGTHRLGKLIAFWDNNGISIDGHIEGWFTDNTKQRFLAYGWHVIEVDGHDASAIREAISEAQSVNDKPSLIACKTVIGFGTPNICGTHNCHGNPLGDAEIKATREHLNWPYEPFVIPKEIYAAYDAKARGDKLEADWRDLFSQYEKAYPDLAKEFLRRIDKTLPPNWQEKIQAFIVKINSEPKDLATRQSSQKCLDFFGPLLPELLGGSADLTPSNLTDWKGSRDITSNNPDGNYIHYGIREFGMLAMMNGISLYGGFIPYGGTFLVFCNYAHSAIRMAALMQIRSIYVFTHDSIGVGEDGPTHQPIEHLNMLRGTPNLSLWRPCDSIETAIAWEVAIERINGPTALALTRQKLPQQKYSAEMLLNIKKGGYVLLDCAGTPDCIVIATGSEVAVAAAAVKQVRALGKKVRLVSMPSTDTFSKQDSLYQESVLPKKITKRLAIEAGSSDFWYKYVGLEGKILGIDRFGESAPQQEIFALLGFTEQNIARIILGALEL
ncbi:MAG: transketolase [Gammaproteobacteria bacterium]